MGQLRLARSSGKKKYSYIPSQNINFLSRKRKQKGSPTPCTPGYEGNKTAKYRAYSIGKQRLKSQYLSTFDIRGLSSLTELLLLMLELLLLPLQFLQASGEIGWRDRPNHGT